MYLDLPYLIVDFCVSLDLWLEPCGLEADDISQNPFPILSEVDGQQPLIQEGVPLDTLKNGLFFSSTLLCKCSMCAETEVRLAIYTRFLF